MLFLSIRPTNTSQRSSCVDHWSHSCANASRMSHAVLVRKCSTPINRIGALTLAASHRQFITCITQAVYLTVRVILPLCSPAHYDTGFWRNTVNSQSCLSCATCGSEVPQRKHCILWTVDIYIAEMGSHLISKIINVWLVNRCERFAR